MSTETAHALNATVIGREEIHRDLLVLRVRPDDKLFEFKPGQFAVLGLPGSAPRVATADLEQPPAVFGHAKFGLALDKTGIDIRRGVPIISELN